jgi:hypothetical protein
MSDLSAFLWQLGTEMVPVKNACTLCGTVLRGTDEKAVGVCILCRPKKYRAVCEPCDPLNVSPDRVLAVLGVCALCGDRTALYSIPEA